ncbi:MAG: transposase, partial [Deltaproteobacteria bacterium]|nr:transposase [Deltaproteobacteria bacterium]
HFAWNVIGRKPMFKNSFNKIDFICEAFSNCGEMVGGFVSLLWLAPDHVHVYVESDGEFPVESIAQKMKRSTAASILAEFTDLKVSPHAENELWDKAYFVETIG